jgi:DNA-directed RNA polymerase specialized sigma24 family protein
MPPCVGEVRRIGVEYGQQERVSDLCRTDRDLQPLMTGRQSVTRSQPDKSFSEFMEQTEPRLRRALGAGFGSQLGREATLEAFEYAWEHWSRVQAASNPAGYVYRVGAHWAARERRRGARRGGFDAPPPHREPWVEPKLDGALDRLTRPQRTAVVLIHGFGWTYQEVSELLQVRRSTIQRHVSRAMNRLRSELGVRDAVA